MLQYKPDLYTGNKEVSDIQYLILKGLSSEVTNHNYTESYT